MNWIKIIEKGVLGFLTWITAYLVSNPSAITNMIPEEIVNMTVGGAVAGLLVALANWLKHLKDSN